MKFIVSFLGFAALAFALPLLAQEESPSPASEETPSTTVESVQESPAPTESATPETKATAAATATIAAQPTAEKKAPPTPATKTSPTTSPMTAAAGKKMSGPAALKESENRWAAALGKHDAATVEAMLAPDCVGVNAKGKVQNRRAMLNEIKGDKETYTSTKNEKLDVRMYGANVAVVIGTYREKGTGKDGKAFDRTYRFTDTWMDRGGNWQCIASHVTLVAQK
jgi:ketosteroid isomerase-like protein